MISTLTTANHNHACTMAHVKINWMAISATALLQVSRVTIAKFLSTNAIHHNVLTTPRVRISSMIINAIVTLAMTERTARMILMNVQKIRARMVESATSDRIGRYTKQDQINTFAKPFRMKRQAGQFYFGSCMPVTY